MARIPLARQLSTAAREAAAFARQAWLLPRDVGEPVLPRACAPTDDVVVLLHGLFASAGVLRPLEAALSRQPGVCTAKLTYLPGPGIEELAARLLALVAEIPPHARLHLVGHSLGGIVMRYVAQQHPELAVAQTISLASPFAGVPRAALLRMDGTRDLDEQSALLRSIRLDMSRCQVPHLSIIAEGDQVVKSPVAHALPGWEVRVMPGLGHNALLFDPGVLDLVVGRVLNPGT